jgi:hypothetical protein
MEEEAKQTQSGIVTMFERLKVMYFHENTMKFFMK